VADTVKNAITSSGPKDGEFSTSTSASAPVSASGNPAPVATSTPDERDAATTSWSLRSSTTLPPTSPPAPMTAIFTAQRYGAVAIEGVADGAPAPMSSRRPSGQDC
jgi:hypothetical protein